MGLYGGHVIPTFSNTFEGGRRRRLYALKIVDDQTGTYAYVSCKLETL